MTAFLWQIRRRKIDGHFLGGHRKPGGMQRRLHSFAAFGYGLVGQTDDLHARLSRSDHHLHINRDCLDSLKRDRTYPRNHAVPSEPRAC